MFRSLQELYKIEGDLWEGCSRSIIKSFQTDIYNALWGRLLFVKLKIVGYVF